MKKYLLFTLSLMIINSCCLEDELIVGPTICLEDFEINIIASNCVDEIKNECDMFYQGSFGLSEEAKENFNNFCPGIYSTFIFEDSNNVRLYAFLSEKSFDSDTYSIIKFSPCNHFCLDNENAKIDIVSDFFSLKINLLTGLTFENNSMLEIVTKPQTVYSIIAYTKNKETGSTTGQQIFELPIEDYNNKPIVNPDTTDIRFHETISLNNTIYSNVYSNENKENVNGYTRKEKVYFNQEIGLIAVRDSLGTLWTIVE